MINCKIKNFVITKEKQSTVLRYCNITATAGGFADHQICHSNRCQFITSQLPASSRSRDLLEAGQDESLRVSRGDSADLFEAEPGLGFNRSLRDHNCSPFAFSPHLADPWPLLSRAD